MEKERKKQAEKQAVSTVEKNTLMVSGRVESETGTLQVSLPLSANTDGPIPPLSFLKARIAMQYWSFTYIHTRVVHIVNSSREESFLRE